MNRVPDPSRCDVLTSVFLGMHAAAPDPADLFFGLLLRAEGPMPTVTQLRAHVRSRLPLLPWLSRRIAADGDGPPRWEPDPRFDLAVHVTAGSGPAALAPSGAWLGEGADPDRPLWRMILLPGHAGDGEWGLVFLAHHAAQDGTGVISTLHTLFGQDPPGGSVPAGPWVPRRLTAWRAGAALLGPLPAPAGLAMIHSAPTDARLPHRADVPLDLLRRIGRAVGASIGQTHLAATAGAIRRWSPQDFTGPRGHGRDVPALVPLDTRLPGEEPAVGSLIGLLRVALPTGTPEPLPRLTAARTLLSASRVARERVRLRAVVEDLPAGLAVAALRRLGDRRGAELTVSVFRPLGPLRVLGRPVLDACAIPWMPPGAGCFSILTSYRGNATLSVLTDGPPARPGGDLASCWAHEVHALYERLSG